MINRGVQFRNQDRKQSYGKRRGQDSKKGVNLPQALIPLSCYHIFWENEAKKDVSSNQQAKTTLKE